MKAEQSADRIFAEIDNEAQLRVLERDVSPTLVPGSLDKAVAAMGGTQPASRTAVTKMFEPEKLEVEEGLNPRVPNEGYKAHIRDLVSSMVQHGFYSDKPLAGYITKRDGIDTVIVYDGGSRLVAAIEARKQGARFTTIPVVIDQKGKAKEDILVAMVRGNTGRRLAPYELGLICKRLITFNWDTKRIATELGITVQYTEKLLKLMAADFRIREMVAYERVSAETAISTLTKYPERAYEVLTEALDTAQGAGKTKVTMRFVASAMVERAAKKAAVPMYEALKSVMADDCFDALSDQNQAKLKELLSTLEEVEANARKAESKRAEASSKQKKAQANSATLAQENPG